MMKEIISKLGLLLPLVLLLTSSNLNSQSCTEQFFSATYWSSYLGGNGEDEIMDLTIDQSSGQLYIIGHTTSTNLSITNLIGTSGTKNTFVASINPNASIAWISLIGGWENPHKVELDHSGNLILVGMTNSNVLPGPSTVPGYDKSYNGGQDLLILKLNSNGQNIIYSSYYGGNGDETNEQDGTIELSIFDESIYLIGNSSSTDLITSSNAIDQTPGDLYIAVLNLATNTLDYSTYLTYQKPNFLESYSLAVNSIGEMSIIVSYNVDYSSFILPGAVQTVADNDNPHPMLFRFNYNFDVIYGTYLSPIRPIWSATTCSFNGVGFQYNYYDFDLEIDNANNIYFYQTGNNFRSPVLRRQDIAFARNYFPDLSSFTDDCDNSTGSTIMKINFCEESTPFLENIVFGLWGDGSVSPPAVISEIEVDDFGRVHFVSSYDSESPIYSLANDPISSLGGNYIIYDSELRSSTVRQLFGLESTVYPRRNFHSQLELYDNKAYMVGRSSDIIQTTPTWTDENGSTNTVIQSTYGGNSSDGIIQVIDNNCVDIPYDCCNDIVPPTFDCSVVLPDITIDQNGQGTLDLNTLPFNPTDDCTTATIVDPFRTYSCNSVLGPNDPQIYTTIAATDVAGNTTQCQFELNVVDPNDNCCSHPDLAGLRAFYDAAGGDMWKNTLANDLPWFEDCDPCGLMDGTPWFGVRCNANDRVGGFQLNFNDLSGIITPDIDLLPELSGVIIYDNPGLMGSIPASICNLNITTFYIFRNNHTGIIPPCMTGITSLIDLNFKDNSLVGPIPDFGSGTPNLFNLNLNNNNLTGGLPASLADIPNPSTMTFNGNMLQGCYPAVLENLCNSNNGTLQGLDNSTVSDGNNFDADWEDFCLSNAGACTVSAEDEWLAKIISVYPNPMDDLIHIQSKSDDHVEARLYSIEGELLHIEQIKSNTTRVINTELTPGVYLLRMNSGNGYLTKKIIKI